MYAIAVSDIHLGYDKCDKSAFKAFISELENPTGKILTDSKERIEHLVLIGDILDFWRGQNERVLLENMDVLQRINDLKRVSNIHFVYGNHDYSMKNIQKGKAAKFRFTDDLRFPEKDEPGLSSGKRYMFIHGHQIEFGKEICFELAGEVLCNAGDLSGGMMAHAWDTLKHLTKTYNPLRYLFYRSYCEFVQNPPEERSKPPSLGSIKRWIWNCYSDWKPILTMNEIEIRDTVAKRWNLAENEVLVFGHTHKPWEGNLIANTGCWYQGEEHNYVAVDDHGDFKLRTW